MGDEIEKDYIAANRPITTGLRLKILLCQNVGLVLGVAVMFLLGKYGAYLENLMKFWEWSSINRHAFLYRIFFCRMRPIQSVQWFEFLFGKWSFASWIVNAKERSSNVFLKWAFSFALFTLIIIVSWMSRLSPSECFTRLLLFEWLNGKTRYSMQSDSFFRKAMLGHGDETFRSASSRCWANGKFQQSLKRWRRYLSTSMAREFSPMWNSNASSTNQRSWNVEQRQQLAELIPFLVVYYLVVIQLRVDLTSILISSMTSSTPDVVPDVLPSQVLSVSPSLPSNKLLDNLTVNQLESFILVANRIESLEKSTPAPITATELREASFLHRSLQNTARWLLLLSRTIGHPTVCCHLPGRHHSYLGPEPTGCSTGENARKDRKTLDCSRSMTFPL